MTRLAVVTPSFGPDAHLFASLHRSVLRHTDPDVTHHVIVPPRDIRRFGEFEGPRCRIISESDLLPPWFWRLPRPGWWANLRRPWPPVRGWVLQQALKFAVVGCQSESQQLLPEAGSGPLVETAADGAIRAARGGEAFVAAAVHQRGDHVVEHDPVPPRRRWQPQRWVAENSGRSYPQTEARTLQAIIKTSAIP